MDLPPSLNQHILDYLHDIKFAGGWSAYFAAQTSLSGIGAFHGYS
jgi:hypothetical protein